jgi:hypothetical protein
MLWYTCLIKHAKTLLRAKDCCTYSLLHAQQDALTHNKASEKSDYLAFLKYIKNKPVDIVLLFFYVNIICLISTPICLNCLIKLHHHSLQCKRDGTDRTYRIMRLSCTKFCWALSLYQAVLTHWVVRRRGSHIFRTIGSGMAVSWATRV